MVCASARLLASLILQSDSFVGPSEQSVVVRPDTRPVEPRLTDPRIFGGAGEGMFKQYLNTTNLCWLPVAR